MQHIDRLLIRVKKAIKETDYQLAVGLVRYDEDTREYIAQPQSWDSKPIATEGACAVLGWWHDTWPTEEEAANALNRLFDCFEVPKDNCLIFIMDYGLED